MKPAFILIIVLTSILWFPSHVHASESTSRSWDIQSVDTMKSSRDVAREKSKDPLYQNVIDKQINDIATLNVTHIAIGTPYDEEFLPFLRMWVNTIRKKNLHVWFRGNWSGWERWFQYPSISRVDHIAKTKSFILSHPDVFSDGDIFSTCPECENGKGQDPRLTGDVAGFRKFIIDEYTACTDAFKRIGKNVTCNYFSMNADVAKLIMDKKTTAKIGGVVTIDHYVQTPQELADDIRQIASNSAGRVVLGEFGVPIPDINGSMSEDGQSQWLSSALEKLYDIPELVGVNYWLNIGGSTALWNDDGTPKKSVGVISDAYRMHAIAGKIYSQQNEPIPDVIISTGRKTVTSDSLGRYRIPYTPADTHITYAKNGYSQEVKSLPDAVKHMDVTLKMESPSLFRNIRSFIFHIYIRIIELLGK